MMRSSSWLVLLAACTGGTAPIVATDAPATNTPVTDASQTAPVDGDSLMITLSLDPGNVNPLVAPYAVSGWIIDLVNPGLVRRVMAADGLAYEPAIAKSWTWSPDKRALTYAMRDDVVWEDGTPLTADDVVFTYELIADPLVASNWMGDADSIEKVTADGPHTVTFHFVGPRNEMLQQGVTIRGILPKHILKDVPRDGLREHDSGRNPTASGAFRVAAWTPMQRIILEPNPKAPADWRPHLERIVFTIQPEPSTRKLAMLMGSVDYDPAVEPAQLAEYRTKDDLEVISDKAASMSYIGYNLTHPKWQDPNLRRALTLATDRDALIERIFTFGGEALAQPCVSTVGPNLGGWSASDLAPLPYDPAKARTLLAGSGWVDSDKDGILDKGGKALRVRLMYQNGDDAARDLLTMVQRQWKDVGVDLQMEPLDGVTFQSRARNKNYDAVLWGFGNNPLVKPAITWSTGGPYNWFGYSNPKVDAALAEGETAADLAVAQAAVRRAQHLIHADQPVTFLLWSDNLMVRHKRFRDVEHNTFNQVLHAERWWVAKAAQKY